MELSPLEQRVLSVYRDPANSDIGRATRLSIQYAVGAACFVFVGIQTNNAYWSLAVFAILVIWMSVRLVAARRIAGVMPGIIQKLEARIAELEADRPKLPDAL